MKNIIKKIIYLYTLIFISYNSNGQVTKDLPNYFPVSPNAASFAKQGLYPVDYSTGRLNVNVPIYTIKTREITVPISISYNTSGIQLNETASWVGLGWNLGAGGAIVRNTKGIPDKALGIQKYWTPIPMLSTGLVFNHENYKALYLMQKGEQDTAPDEYIVSAPGLSGSFYFDQNDSYKAYFRDFQNTKVKIISDNEIEITKDDGTIYKFGKTLKGVESVEVTSNPTESIQSLGTDFISAWYLTEIISVNGTEIISFNYKSIDSYDYPVVASENLYPATVSSWIRTNYPVSTKIKKQFLQSITFSNGRIDFISALDREDLILDYKLNSIEVYSVLNNKSLLIQKSNFNYDYYVRSGGNVTSVEHNSDYGGNRNLNSRNKSLRLKEIIDSQTNTKYTFDYNNIQLPLRGTNKQDYWGYINNNSGSLMPPTKMDLNNQVGNTRIINFGTGDRKANETLMQSGILKKITYPEGGYSIFEYEANKYDLKESIPTIVPRTASVVAYGYDSKNCTVHTANTTFTPKNYIPGSGKLIISFMPATDENGGSTNVTFDSEIFFRPLPFTLGGNFTYTREFSDSSHTLSANEFRTGNIGAYGCPISSITASWEEYSEFKEVITTKLVGGVRIKSIENFDQIGAITPVSIKRFDYQEENILNKEGLGSYKRYIILTDNPGIQESTPVCSTSALYNNNIGGSPNITYGKIIETEINPNTSVTNGKTEYYYQNIISERTIIDAPTTFRHPLFILHYPYSTLMLKYTLNIYDFSYYKNDSWNYGSLINTITYKRDTSNTLKKIKSVENKYTILKQLELPYNLVFNIFSDPYGPYDPNFTPEPYIQGKSIDYYSAQFIYFTGKVSLGKKVMTSTTETDYDENEKITTKKTISYSFENPVHNQVTRMQTSNSNNETLETKYLYPQDAIVASEPFVNELKDKNIVGVPLTTLSYNGVTKLSEQKTVYDKSLATSNLLLPRYIYANKGVGNINNSTDKKITFDQYDDKGNLVQYTLEGGTPVSIIWGYNKTQPIAKIENATYASIPLETITSLQALSNADDDNCMSANCTEQLLRNGLDAFRATLPNAFITTYTYNPLVGVTSITDPSRISTYYHYDKFNRLQYIKDQDLNIVQTYYYNYKGQIIDYLLPEASIYKNVAISKIYTKNDCSTGASASVMYKVAIGTFSSSISQADADAQAQADISKNGQAYANNNGVCSYRNKGISKLFTKNDCGETGIPATMYYTIAEDRYNSTISQADADAQAQVNLNNFGQEYVNANGYCTYQNEELRGNFSLFSEDFGLFKVAYHVPSGKFTSTISQIDADEIAQQGLSQCQNEYSCLMVECQELLEEDGMAITNYDCDNISFTIMPFEEEN